MFDETDGGEAEVIEVELVPDGPQGVGTAQIAVGHVKPVSLDVKTAPLEFSFEGLSDEAQRNGFSVDPIKGTVEPGTTKSVNVSFALRPEALASTEMGLVASFGVSQWAEAPMRLVLKGGNPLTTRPEMAVLLKGFIPCMSATELQEAKRAASAGKGKK